MAEAEDWTWLIIAVLVIQFIMAVIKMVRDVLEMARRRRELRERIIA